MSAFIISDKTMKDIIYNLFWNHEFKRMYSIFRYNNLNKEFTEYQDFHKLAGDFYKMNRDAVKQRYDESEESEYIKIPDCENIDWTGNGGKLNKYQALKSMKCLRYQCSEGDVPETELYKFLTSLINAWMGYIINEIPEYRAAGWDEF